MLKRIILFSLLLLLQVSLFSQSGRIRGRVMDEEKYEPLPFVNVVVQGTNSGAATDMNGEFVITGLEPGIYTLKATFIGYKPAYSDEIEINNAKTAFIEITMEQLDLEIGEVTVTPSKYENLEESPVSVQQIQVSDIEKSPGANRDISKVIQSFPGVGSSVSFRNDIIVRGGGPSESVFYLDGIEIPTLNHFSTQGASGGAVGIINADLIQNVNYYSGAFPANRNNALSGVFEFKLKDGNKDQTNRRIAVGASETALTMDGPILNNTTYLLSLRRSYLQFLFDAIGLPFLPTFNDVLFKSETNFNQKNRLTLIGLGALDKSRLNTGIDNPDKEQQYILNYLPEQDQWNYMVGANYKHVMGKSFQNLIFSRNVLNNESFKYINNNKNPENEILDYKSQEIENNIRINNTYRNKGYKVVLSGQLSQAKYSNSTYQKRFIGNQTNVIDYDTDLTFYKWGLSGQISKAYLRDKLRLSLGVRTDANNYSSSMNNLADQLSPRFSASYSLTKKFNINFNTGLYYELPPYTSLGFTNSAGELVNKQNGIKYISVAHYIAGFEFFRNADSKISLEGFYKKYDDYPISLTDSISLANKGADFTVIGDEEIISQGKGRAFGLELSGRYVLFEDMESIVSYTLVKSEFDNLEGEYIPSSWDSRHIFTMTTTKPFGQKWQAGYRLRYVSGLPYTPYDLEKSSLVTAWQTRGQPFKDFTEYNSKRLKDFVQLDIRIDRRFYFSNIALTLYLDVQNVLNYQAEQPDIIIPKTDSSGDRIIVNPEAPKSEQRYELERIDNTTGTVLPTIGIILDF